MGKKGTSDRRQKKNEYLLKCNANGNSGLLTNLRLGCFEGYDLGIKRL